MNWLLWIPAFVIAVRALCVAYKAHFARSGRTALGFGLFGYGYVLLAYGALAVAAEQTGCAGELAGSGAPAILIASAMLIISDRRQDRVKP